MKIAVIGACLNDESKVPHWIDCTRAAEYRVVIDLGSTDLSVQRLARAGIDVLHAENGLASAALTIPSHIDYCLFLALDEDLSSDQGEWIEALAQALRQHGKPFLVARVAHWSQDGMTPATICYTDRLLPARMISASVAEEHLLDLYSHDPSAIHESSLRIRSVLDPHSPSRWRFKALNSILDRTPDRPHLRALYQLGRTEYGFGDPASGAQALNAFLEMTPPSHSTPELRWYAERASALRLIARGQEVSRRVSILLQAVGEDSRSREAWSDLACAFLDAADWPGCYFAATRALEIRDQRMSEHIELSAWSDQVTYLMELSGRRLGLTLKEIRTQLATLTSSPGVMLWS